MGGEHRVTEVKLCLFLELVTGGFRKLKYLKTKSVYYESTKRELQRRLINEGRCDERLTTKVEEYT